MYIHKNCGGDAYITDNDDVYFCIKCRRFITEETKEDELEYNHCIMSEQDIKVISQRIGYSWTGGQS